VVKLKIGIIGCGAIGSELVRAITSRRVPGAIVAGLADRKPEKAEVLACKVRPHCRVLNLKEIARACDLIIETAEIPAVPVIAKAVLTEKKDLLILSVGALIAYPDLLHRFQRRGCGLYYPSGAVAGLDALRAAAIGGKIKRVYLTTRKPIAGLAGAPYFKKRKIDPLSLTKATKIFSGSARQAIKLFPQNINVAAAISLSGIGPDRTRVEIIADPRTRRNSHTLEIEGQFGAIKTITENLPSPTNPKTSALAAASALALLAALVQRQKK
jgi:aspartate dehydrogenase